jgi:acetamidase/formamidase
VSDSIRVAGDAAGHESALHTVWDRDLSPALRVDSGTVVRFDCLNDSGPRIGPATESADLPDIEFVGHHLTGPVAVEGASPGDMLQVDILEVEDALCSVGDGHAAQGDGEVCVSAIETPTTGVRDDLMDAAKDAVRRLVDHLHENRGLTRPQAYVLCSVAADLKINEIVDEPNWVVSAYLADSLFPDE